MTARSTKRAEPDQVTSSEWLEQELRETRARLQKVEGELAQALKKTYALEDNLRKVTESVGVTGSVENAVQAFREDVRQVRDQLSRMQDRQATITARMEQIQNQRQAELGRDREDLAAALKQIEAMTRVVEGYDARVKDLEETNRRLEDELSSTRSVRAAGERTLGEIAMRSTAMHEATLRLEQQTSHFATQIDALEQSDENLVDRMTLFLEQLRRVLERLDKLESYEEFQTYTQEALQKVGQDREIDIQRIGIAERLANDIADRMDEMSILLSRVDQKSQQNTAEIASLTAQMQDQADQIKAGLKKVYQTFLRQRRRASEAMNQEIKELTHGELHAGD
jgi:chromosome segregation ATPase